MRRAAFGLVLLAAVLTAPPSLAQGRSCDDGRGAEMADLGFDRLVRSSRTDAATGRSELLFEPEPRVTGVRSDGPAAGRLREGDVVLAIEGHPITTAAAARAYAEIRGGDVVSLRVRRDGREQEVRITAATRCVPFPPVPPAAPAAPAAPVPPAPPGDELMPAGSLGFTIECRDCGKEEIDGVPVFRFRQSPVVATVTDGSSAAAAGVRAGDLLTQVDGVPLTAPNGWTRFSAIAPGQTVTFTFSRDGQPYQVTVRAR